MKLISVRPDDLVLSDDLMRTRTSKQFEERLRSSIEEMGLAEPLKVAPLPSGKYLVIDGTLRLKAILGIRQHNPSAFSEVPVYLADYDQRYEIRFQTDIYQDLLPSQLATLVEHLHRSEHVKKADIARYIGVSPATLRNYTGLSRLMERGGLFAKIVELMDLGILPSSNPYAWLRLTYAGLRAALELLADEQETAEAWVQRQLDDARKGRGKRIPIALVESVTGTLQDHHYRGDADTRMIKKALGTRRSQIDRSSSALSPRALRNLEQVTARTDDLVLKHAARALQVYLT